MFNRGKSWLPGLLSKPKNPHSLEHLKYLYNVLCRNQTVTEQNRVLLVETLRSISEILIWGDQNDSSVFDFFLEKNMLSFFLRYLQQKCGRYICVQLLQTLNILFENIRNETSLYYLLSNNHINAIIVHKFDFSDEEVMAYYISFLKTLSLKLNKHTIHFFYNEHTNDFALYTEAIKFFNHSESMVRIAVRTITLNVYKVYMKFQDVAMLRYIRDRTAAPYFSNLVWFIGSHILDLDICVRNDADHQSRDRLSTLVAEHLDHLHYVNDILLINIDTLNDVLSDQLLNRLLVPLYVYSLTKRKRYDARIRDRKHVSSVVSLFLLSQVFLIIKHVPLVRQLAEIIFQGDITPPQPQDNIESDSPRMRVREFVAPEESLEETLDGTRGLRQRNQSVRVREGNSTFFRHSEVAPSGGAVGAAGDQVAGSQDEVFEEELTSPSQNSTDEEKILSSRSQSTLRGSPVLAESASGTFTLDNRPYLEAVFHALECTENDYETLFALCLLYAMGHNDGIHQGLMDAVFMPTERSETKEKYNVALVERLIRIITLASQHGSKVRLATLELGIKLLKQLVYKPGQSTLQDRHLASVENARECSTQLLRNFYKSEEIFLDMFEDEYREMTTRPLNVEYLTMDASILLPPTGTPLTGIEFNKRLPCGEVERARRAIRVFFLVRELSLTLMQDEESQLPLTKDKDCVKIDNILDLNNSDLIACTVVTKERKQERRFLVIDAVQMILVEPDTRRLGWGIVTFVGFLQRRSYGDQGSLIQQSGEARIYYYNIEVTGDKEDSRSLHITVHKPASSHHVRPVPLLAARFIFDDHIRCMAAKQRLTKGRMRARQQKMQMIERLLDIPLEAQSSNMGHFSRSGPIPGRSHPVRVSSSSALERGSHHSRPSATQSVSHDRLPSQSSQGSVSHDSSDHQPDSHSVAHDSAVNQSAASSLQRVPVGDTQEPRVESVNVDQVTVTNTQNQNENASMEIDDGEIEVAEEATSEMAFQTLHQTDTSSRHDTSSQESSPGLQEIPLEDLSRKNRSKRKQQLTRARLTKTRLKQELRQEQARSLSQSPSRKKVDETERVRSSSLTMDTVDKHRDSVPGRRAHSDSSPLRSDLKPSHGKKKCSVSTQVQTKLVLEADIKHPKNEEKEQLEANLDKLGIHSPKTLIPSQSPAVSLVPDVEKAFRAKLIADSPKLVPPVEAERIRSLSDVSMSSGEDTGSVSSNKTSDSQERPNFGFNVPSQAEAELSPANVEVKPTGTKDVQATTEQLTKLAQMVQEHYKFDQEAETELTEEMKK